MTEILNPWLVIPVDTCAEGDFDAFAECQLSGFDQPKSEVWALYMIPDGAPLPDPWTSEGGWTGVIDNTDTTGTKGRYMAGKGSFLKEGYTNSDFGCYKCTPGTLFSVSGCKETGADFLSIFLP
jgi:hypothetical protein